MDSADDQCDANPHRLAEGGGNLFHLLGKFPCRAQYQRLDCDPLRIEFPDDGAGECEGFSGTCLCLADQIFSRHGNGNGEFLDGGWVRESEFGEPTQNT